LPAAIGAFGAGDVPIEQVALVSPPFQVHMAMSLSTRAVIITRVPHLLTIVLWFFLSKNRLSPRAIETLVAPFRSCRPRNGICKVA